MDIEAFYLTEEAALNWDLWPVWLRTEVRLATFHKDEAVHNFHVVPKEGEPFWTRVGYWLHMHNGELVSCSDGFFRMMYEPVED